MQNSNEYDENRTEINSDENRTENNNITTEIETVEEKEIDDFEVVKSLIDVANSMPISNLQRLIESTLSGLSDEEKLMFQGEISIIQNLRSQLEC